MGPDSESERLLDSDRSLVESPWWGMDNLDSTGPSNLKVGLSVWEARGAETGGFYPLGHWGPLPAWQGAGRLFSESDGARGRGGLHTIVYMMSSDTPLSPTPGASEAKHLHQSPYCPANASSASGAVFRWRRTSNQLLVLPSLHRLPKPSLSANRDLKLSP